MTTLVNVTLTTTSGEEISGKAHYDPASGLVTLPTTFQAYLELAKAAGTCSVITVQENGYQIPLIHHQDVSFRMDRSRRVERSALAQSWLVVRLPSKDLRQQWGRFLHTLSAAAIIGAVGYFGASQEWTTRVVTDVIGLVAIGVVLFIAGTIVFNGDRT